MLAWRMAWRQFRSVWSSGKLRVLLFALILAVSASTAVSFFTERLQQSLQSQGNVLLGADLVVNADHVLPAAYQTEAQRRTLLTTQTMEFPSMAVLGEHNALVEIKAVQAGFPLRGRLSVSKVLQTDNSKTLAAQAIPEPGTVWVEPALARKLNLQLGEVLSLGDGQFRVAAWLLQEPSRGGDLFAIAPRVLMNQADVASTGLIQLGSRVKYQLLVAATTPDMQAVTQFADWLQPQLGRGERVEDIATARPEMRNALMKAQQFLGIAAMVGVILAMVAMWLASLPYVQNSLDTYALMRCFGASKALITRILLLQTLLLAALGSAIGCLLGFAAQYGLAFLAGRLFLETLPNPGWMPVLWGLLTGFATLLSVVWPQYLRLRAVPALRMLRHDLESQAGRSVWLYLPALLVLAGLVYAHAGDAMLAVIVLAALAGLILVAAGLAWLGLRALHTRFKKGGHTGFGLVGTHGLGVMRLGLLGLKRRPAMTIAQVVGLSMGLMAVLLLMLVRNDLLSTWQTSLPADAPNRFVINIQPDQIAAVAEMLDAQHLQHSPILPMVRARLMAVNARAVRSADYADERAKRMVEREFNLSWTANLPADNQLLAGQWWSPAQTGLPLLSLEQKLADTLALKLGDRLTFDVAGTPLTLTLSSLRKVEWGSLHVNFFAVTPPKVLDAFAASYLTSVYLPADKEAAFNQGLKPFANLTIINVAAVLEQLQALINKMTLAIECVFVFSLLAGLAVLYAALLATRDERMRESTLLRVLGASRRQVGLAMLVEFAAVGGLASLVALLFTHVAAYFLATQLLQVEYQFNARLSMQALLVAMTLVPLAAWLVVRHSLNQPPRALLHSV